jgi:hypothetical protein
MDIIIKNAKFYIGQIIYLEDSIYGSKEKSYGEYEVKFITIGKNNEIIKIILQHIIPIECGNGRTVELYDDEFELVYFTKPNL